MIVNTFFYFLGFFSLGISLFIGYKLEKRNNALHYMDDESKFEMLLELIRDCHYLILNMNDTFGYACADSEQMDASDVEEILHTYQKYGSATLIAYASVKTGDLPIKPLRTKEFFKAKKELEKLAENGTILYYEFLKKKEDEKAH